MGKPVTVDSDDLKIVVMATGFVKSIEKVLEAHKCDPFVCRDDETLSKVHGRLATAMVRAKRGEIHPQYDEPLTEAEINLLKNMDFSLDSKKKFAVYRVDPEWMRLKGSPPAGFSGLRAKGMIEIGSVFECTLWQSEPKETRIDKAEFRLRITDRGQAMLCAMAAKDAAVIQ